MVDNSYKFWRECLIRHYRGMSRNRALRVLRELKTKKAKQEFKNRINKCKGEEFIR